MLDKHLDARGLGISLPTEQGGHDYALESRLRSRHTLVFADLLAYDLSPSSDYGSLGYKHLPPGLTSAKPFDLVILDGHYLDAGYRSSDNPHTRSPKSDVQRLLVAQIVIAFQAVATGGTIVMKLGSPENHVTARVLWMLDQLCGELVTYKPRTSHATRNMFYAVAKRVGYGRQGRRMNKWWRAFQELWVKLSVKNGKKGGRWMSEKDLDFLISTQQLNATWGSRLVELGHDVWSRQSEALFAKACKNLDSVMYEE